MTVRLTEEIEQMLDRLSAQTGLSKQKAVVEAIRQMDQRFTRKTDLAAAREFVLTHDSELMQKLAD
jgi:hypothetical protein